LNPGRLPNRFSFSLVFGLPDEPCRAQILKQYAKQLPEGDIGRLAAGTDGFSGRDLRDICEQVRGPAARAGFRPLSVGQRADAHA
jgi:AAA+ superfamily predicted ATPase